MCRRPRIWTEETLVFLTENYASTSNDELSKLMGISVSSLKKKAHELNLSKHSSYKLTEKVKKIILSMYKTNSYQSIADKLYISRRTVARFIKEQKEKGLQPRGRDVELKIMSEYRTNQYKIERARATFGLPQKTRYKIFPNKNKYWIRQSLRKYGYQVGRNSLEVYVLPSTDIHRRLEAKAKKCGFHFNDGLKPENIIILSINNKEIMEDRENMMLIEDVDPMSCLSGNGPAEEQIAEEYHQLHKFE